MLTTFQLRGVKLTEVKEK